MALHGPSCYNCGLTDAQPGDKVRSVEEAGIVPAKMREIQAVETQIDKVKGELDAARSKLTSPGTAAALGGTLGSTSRSSTARTASLSATAAPAIGSMDQWFATYRRPAKETFGGDGFKSTFVSSTKIYGGSAHYGGAFLSMSRLSSVAHSLDHALSVLVRCVVQRSSLLPAR